MKENLNLLVEKLMHVIKENLLDVIRSRDGMYSLLFVKNCFNYLIQNADDRRMETVKLMQSEFYAIMTELGGKEKKEEKVVEEGNSNMDTAMNSDDLNVSMISDDSDISMDKSIVQDNSSNDNSSLGISQTKSTSNHSDPSKPTNLFHQRAIDKNEMRVYLSMSKHIIIELYFSINTFLVKEMSGINTEIEETTIEENKPEIESAGR